MIELWYFTCVFLGVRHFLWYQDQGHLSRSRSNIKVIIFRKVAVTGAFMFLKYISYFQQGTIELEVMFVAPDEDSDNDLQDYEDENGFRY